MYILPRQVELFRTMYIFNIAKQIVDAKGCRNRIDGNFEQIGKNINKNKGGDWKEYRASASATHGIKLCLEPPVVRSA